MNRSITLFAAIALGTTAIFSACTKKTDNTVQPQTQNDPNNEPQQQQLTYKKKTAPVFMEYTSTGCPGCGSWGKPTFASISATHSDDITPLAVHIKYGDPMITDESTAIGNNRHGQRYTPQLWVDDENAVVLVGGGISGSSSIQKANDLITANAQVVQPALAANISKENGKLEVTYGVKFIDIEPNGEYGLSCFLTEDGIKHQQSSSASNPATHNHVIRASADGAFGAQFTGSDLMDKEKSWSHSFDISSFAEANTYVTLVLWKKEGSRYVPINGYIAR